MKEIIYSIDRTLCAQFQTLTIKAYTLAPNGLFKEISFSDNKQIQSKVLQELFLEEEIHKKREKNSPYTFFRVRAGKAYSLLQKLACEKLYFEKQHIVCDFFSKLSLTYSSSFEKDTYTLSANIQNKTGTFSFSDCTLICNGSPCFVIRKNFLYFFDENISWSDVKQFLPNGTVTCTRSEFERKSKEIQENGFIITSSNEMQAVTILPLLQLKDRTGAFAELFMDYGNGEIFSFHISPLEKNSSFRDKQEAIWEKDLLECGYQKRGSEYLCPVPQVAKTLDLLLDIGWKVLDVQKKELKRLKNFQVDIHEENNQFQVLGKATFQDRDIAISSLASHSASKQIFIQLGDNYVGLLHRERKDLLPFTELCDEMTLIQEKAFIQKNRLGLILDAAQSCPSIQSHIKEKTALTQIDLFQGSLYPYQQIAVSWLQQLYHQNFSALLADDMGLGKTVQVLAFLASLGIESKTLIVVPTTLLFNWEKEIQTFFPQAKVLLYHGQNRKEAALNDAYTIVLTSYGTLRKEYALFERLLFDTIILDEAQTVKNSSSQIAQIVSKLQASFRISLTGTPIENSLDELYSHFQFLLPNLLDKDEMQPHFARHIQKKIKPFFLRRKKEEIALDLPEKIEQEVLLEMQEEEKANYLKIVASFQKGLLQKISLDGAQKHSMEILEAILRLRQTVCLPALSGLSSDEELPSSKFESVTFDLETILEEKKKVIVFSQFAKMLSYLAAHARKKNWNYLLLDGTTQNRKEIIDRFQTDPEERLFFMSLKAGGVGLNLTAADYVLLYEPWWNEAVENQAFARAHRIGRKDTVILKRYIVKDTIEEAIQKLKTSKKALSNSILEESAFLQSLSLDELLTLI